jgi:hypothetical protein
MSDFVPDLVAACRKTIARFEKQKGHPHLYPAASQALVLRLRERFPDGRGVLDQPAFDEIVALVDAGDEKVAGLHLKDAGRAEVEKALIDRYRILLRDVDTLRVSTRAALESKAAFGGDEILQAPTEAAVIDRLAHNHFLVFPEAFKVFEILDRHGVPQSAFDDVVDQFHFARKINSVIADYLRTELIQYRVLRRKDNDLELQRIPASGLSYLVTEFLLLLSDHRVDVGIRASDLFEQLSPFLRDPEASLHSKWQDDLQPERPLINFEVGGTQVRLSSESLVWQTEQGLVDPKTVGMVVRRNGSEQQLSALRADVTRIVNANSPRNAKEVLAGFSNRGR